MNNLAEKISGDLKAAMKNKDALKTSTLRMLIASIKNAQIEKGEEVLKEEEVLKIISRQVKQHIDSIESFKKGGRSDLIDKETKELEILKSYLPEELSDDEIKNIATKIISEISATSRKDFGRVMKLLIQETRGRADGKKASQIVQGLLKD